MSAKAPPIGLRRRRVLRGLRTLLGHAGCDLDLRGRGGLDHGESSHPEHRESEDDHHADPDDPWSGPPTHPHLPRRVPLSLTRASLIRTVRMTVRFCAAFGDQATIRAEVVDVTRMMGAHTSGGDASSRHAQLDQRSP